MNSSYEASIVRAFGTFVAGGYIERKNKTVPWCASCQTVLATAEIEYQERKDPSIYVQFPLKQDTTTTLFPQVSGKQVSLLVWTTTPWTLPLNRAVVVKPDAHYVLLDVRNDKFVVIGKALADKLCAALKIEKKVIVEFSSKKLAGIKVHHPFIEDLLVPVLFDPFVALDEGTACVHTAPGCGPDDYEIALRNNLEIFSPLSADGRYTEDIEPKELNGMPIVDGQIWVLRKLVELDRLLFKTSIRHPYPHCWRCHNGLIFRATKQWFCDLAQGDLKRKALLACETIQMLPASSVNQLKATIEGRLEWCLSRQRVWGVPITALLCVDCDTPFINQELIEKAAQGIAKQGIEYWDTVDIKQLVPAGFSCKKCHGTQFKKETDILDVWFDSGVSHYAVLTKRKDLNFPADMYLEGKDQHRGWFQSSLLTALVLEGIAPTKTIVTHGFTVDKQGKKMSKSRGNVIAPQEMIDRLGTDGLRLWAASIDMEGEAIVSDVLIRNVQQVFRKVRNTCRFLLSNLYDFDKDKDAIPHDKLSPIDVYALEQLCRVNHDIINKYTHYDLTAVFHQLADYCAVDLSSFYLDIIKDRLYVEKKDGFKRRSAQTVCWHILDTLTRLTAPILSFTAEQISDLSQENKIESIHLQKFSDLQDPWKKLICQHVPSKLAMDNIPQCPAIEGHGAEALMKGVAQQERLWSVLKTIRSAILKAIEVRREQGVMKHSLEAHVTVYFDMEAETLAPLADFYRQLEKDGQDVIAFFKEFMIVSLFAIAPSADGLEQSELPGLFVNVQKVAGDKCPRCWHWVQTTHEHKLCNRCQKIVE